MDFHQFLLPAITRIVFCTIIFIPLPGKLKARWEVRNSKFAPRGLAVTKAGNVLVVDSGNRCVVEFTVGGSYIKKVNRWR